MVRGILGWEKKIPAKKKKTSLFVEKYTRRERKRDGEDQTLTLML